MRAVEFLTDSITVEDFNNLMLSAAANEWVAVEDASDVAVLRSSILAQTLANKREITEKGLLDKFVEFKKKTPLEKYGASDTHFTSEGPLARAIPKLRHAHLTRDISVFYTLEGRNPIVLKLYGVFTHAESGTGFAANIKKQKQLGNTLKQSGL